MKRSGKIRLLLLGGLSAGALSSCGPNPGQTPPVSGGSVYTNDHYVQGVGYYHAPFRNWYGMPYNHYDPQTRRFFHGGEWSPVPHQSVTNISNPTPQAAQHAEATRTDVRRGGFGSTHYGGRSVYT